MSAPRLHPNLLQAENTLLVVVDLQEPFLRNLFERERVLANVPILIQGCGALRIPVVVTRQYVEKMGDLLPPIRTLLTPLTASFDKIGFSCCSSPAFVSELQRSGKKQILLCGVEAHICVLQTALDLVGMGFQVHLVADAVSSRTEANWKIGVDRMRQGGVILSSVETALYELLQGAGTPEFRQILSLIK